MSPSPTTRQTIFREYNANHDTESDIVLDEEDEAFYIQPAVEDGESPGRYKMPIESVYSGEDQLFTGPALEKRAVAWHFVKDILRENNGTIVVDGVDYRLQNQLDDLESVEELTYKANQQASKPVANLLHGRVLRGDDIIPDPENAEELPVEVPDVESVNPSGWVWREDRQLARYRSGAQDLEDLYGDLEPERLKALGGL